jgi:tetratricopeptide (TPR) repeat protein
MNAAVDELLEYALRLTDKIDKAYAKSFNYLEIAEVYLDYGQKPRCLEILAAGLKIIDSLKHPNEKAERLAWAGRICAQAGEISPARESLSRAVLLVRASIPSEVISGLNRVVCEYLDSGFKESAELVAQDYHDAIDKLENDTDKALELVNIADIYAELLQTSKAQEALSEASRIALSIKDNWFKAERLIDVAREYLEIGLKEQAVLMFADIVLAAGLAGEENQPYFLFEIVDIYIAADQILKATEILNRILEIVKRDEQPYNKLKNTLEAAEKYRQLGKIEEALNLLNQAPDDIQSVQNVEDKIGGLAGTAALLGDLEQKQKALDIAGQAFQLCGKVEDKKTRIYLLGTLVLLYVQLKDRQSAAKCLSEIFAVLTESAVKTQGLGPVVIDLASAYEFGLALQLVKVIRDPHIKSSAIANLVDNLIESDFKIDEETHALVKEVTGQPV